MGNQGYGNDADATGADRIRCELTATR